MKGVAPDEALRAVRTLWQAMSDPDGTFPVTHDTYLKLFQLSGPDLSRRWDTILFDEAQDANPVTSALVLGQRCKLCWSVTGISRSTVFVARMMPCLIRLCPVPTVFG